MVWISRDKQSFKSRIRPWSPVREIPHIFPVSCRNDNNWAGCVFDVWVETTIDKSGGTRATVGVVVVGLSVTEGYTPAVSGFWIYLNLKNKSF